MYGRRYEKSKAPNRAPGSLRPNLSAELGEAKLKKLLRNECRVMGPCPFPPQMAVRSNPNSRFSVGRKLNFSTCTQGLAGLITLGWPGPGYSGFATYVCP